MHWQHLETTEQAARIREESFRVPVWIFKHSNRCSLSSMALGRMEKISPVLTTHAAWYLLDVVQARPVSQWVADTFQVHHESPQLLLIRDGECIYEASHLEISPAEAEEQVSPRI
ncbi:MAG: bacillithiol system redox-active protein YtxJ [Bacteroidetes bacterium]|nr:bacillithiol system redox-active protein YtxJ [Bacteroidota bacterium]